MPRAAQVAFTDDFLLDDGTLAFPGYDIAPLKSDPTINLVRVPGGAAHRPGDLGGVDILVSVPHMAAVESRSLKGAESLLAIVRVGVGYEDVDVEACSQAGVAIVVPSEAVRRPTAVAALTLLLALATRLVEKDRLSRNGPQAWEKRAQLRGRNLQGRVLGLVGCGGIGSDFAKLVKPLGMRVIASDPQLDDAAADELGVVRAHLDTVLAEADYVSLHCPLNVGTRHLIDGQRLARMKPGACLINTARGGVVDQAALAGALRSGHLGGAGLDVFEPEPLAEDDPLLSTQNVILSAHALNWTEELDADMASLNTTAIRDLLCGRLPKRIVNPGVLNNEIFTRKLIALSNRSTDDHSTETSAKPRKTQCA